MVLNQLVLRKVSWLASLDRLSWRLFFANVIGGVARVTTLSLRPVGRAAVRAGCARRTDGARAAVAPLRLCRAW